MEDYAVNVTVTSSIAGIMIPPSHNMILFAVATGGGVSITQLFLSGIIPGVVMCWFFLQFFPCDCLRHVFFLCCCVVLCCVVM